jgi:hypothetical protein
MTPRLRRHASHLLAFGLACAAAPPLHAADDDAERGISIFDQYPECMKPDELKPAERKKCEVQDGPPRRPIPAGRANPAGNPSAPGTATPPGVAGPAPATPGNPGGGNAAVPAAGR